MVLEPQLLQLSFVFLFLSTVFVLFVCNARLSCVFKTRFPCVFFCFRTILIQNYRKRLIALN